MNSNLAVLKQNIYSTQTSSEMGLSILQHVLLQVLQMHYKGIKIKN